MLGLLVADANREFIDLVEYIVEKNFNDQINVFKAVHRIEATKVLEKLPIDMMMISFELAGRPEISFFKGCG